MEPIHVLVSARVTAEQLGRMRAIHPRLVIHGEPGGIAIMTPSEAAAKGIDTADIEYPELRPDLDYAGLLAKAEVLFATRIPPDVVARAPRLRWIQFTSAGVDHLWNPSLGKAKIAVTSSKGIHALPMSEFVLSCLLLFAKQWRRLLQQQQDRHWQKFVVNELYGKIIVILGVGEIGRRIGRIAKAFGMYIVGVRRHEGRQGIPGEIDEVFPIAALADVLPRGDYVVAALPLTARTRGLLDEKAFRVMKTSAVFVNVGRGRTVDQGALLRALRESWIAGAALDVLEQEPLPADSPMWDAPNLVISPHMGSDTAMVMERMTEIFYENLRRYAEGQALRNMVDPIEGY